MGSAWFAWKTIEKANPLGIFKISVTNVPFLGIDNLFLGLYSGHTLKKANPS